jgi:hypothetical protein
VVLEKNILKRLLYVSTYRNDSHQIPGDNDFNKLNFALFQKASSFFWLSGFEEYFPYMNTSYMYFL